MLSTIYNGRDVIKIMFNSGYARVLAMISSDSRQGLSARLQSVYINTTGLCMDMFYWIVFDIQPSVLYVKVVAENKTETLFYSSPLNIKEGWNNFDSADFPLSVNQVVIDGERSIRGTSGFFLDDITLATCDVDIFGKQWHNHVLYTALSLLL